MNAKYAVMTIITSLLIAALLLTYGLVKTDPAKGEYVDVYIGIDVAYDNLEEIKTLVDAASPYTNLFIIGSAGITHNETKLNDLSRYLYDKGLSFIVYTEMPPQIGITWIQRAKESWGTKFLGLYVYDEVGGKQLDFFERNATRLHPVHEADNYTDARNQFVDVLSHSLDWVVWNFTGIEDVHLFTSDYALYWFDYKGGYDTVFAEFGWNYSRQINVALGRGAATAQNKEWGVMITHTYTEPPYLDGERFYDDMVYAYKNGAKYIVVFDTNANYTHGTLTEEHLQALKQFTEYAHNNPRTSEPTSERTAFVLPKDFAYGFRGPADKIWGLWEANDFSYDISFRLGKLLEQYGSKLDVIYDDEVDYSSLGYGKFIFWNGTVLNG